MHKQRKIVGLNVKCYTVEVLNMSNFKGEKEKTTTKKSKARDICLETRQN